MKGKNKFTIKVFFILTCGIAAVSASLVLTGNLSLAIQSDNVLPMIQKEAIEPKENLMISRTLTAKKTLEESFWKYANKITTIVFEPTLTPHETTEDLIFDVSDVSDVSVMSYLVPNNDIIYSDMWNDEQNKEEEKATLETAYTLYIQAEGGIIANSNSASLFQGFTNLTRIEGMEYLDTSKVLDMSLMFSDCKRLEALDLTYFNTQNVTNMDGMFLGCTKLSHLNISNFDTHNVTNMSEMFSLCTNLETLDLSHFNTEKVISFSHMFNMVVESLNEANETVFLYNSSLKTVNISSFDTTNAKDLQYMFAGNNHLEDLNVGNFQVDDKKMTEGLFVFLPENTKIKTKDNLLKQWILKLDSKSRPIAWNELNIIQGG